MLVAVTVIAFLPALGAGYVWDDDDYVYANPTLRSVAGLGQIWTDIGATPQYYPLTHTSFWLEYRLWGDAPGGYHATNIALHALTALLLWRVMSVLKVPGAWLAAAVFAVHPIQAESVAWVSERKNVLSGVFYLAAGLRFLRWSPVGRDPDAGSPSGWVYASAVGLYMLALLSKTVTCTLPAALLVVIWWRRGRVTRRDAWTLVPFFVVGIGLALLTILMEREHVGATGAEWDYSWVARCLIAGRAVWFYPGKLIWPWPLTFMYPQWRIDPAAVWQYAFPAGAVLTLVLLWALRPRIGRGPAAAAGFYVLTLFPALGFINVYPMRYSFVADHFSYLACIGLMAGGAAGLRMGAERLRLGRWRGTLAVVMLAPLMALTADHCRDFKDAETLWRDTLAKNPEAWMAHNQLGLIEMRRGNRSAAAADFNEVLRIRSDDVRAMNNLGSLALLAGDTASARGYFGRAIEHEPDFVGARLNLSKTLVSLGEIREASQHYLHALRVDPATADVEGQLALVLLNGLDPPSADQFYQAAIGVRAPWPELTNETAWILATHPIADSRQADRSLELALRAASLAGDDPNVLDTLAAAYAACGDYLHAVEQADAAIALATRQGLTALAEEIRKRRERYLRSEPYRTPGGNNQP
ncbi:MAG: tetratricopeptide repeat protein [Phycisphaeraceae bacterium]|nr:tetratricopeptide repeat protein [Phycisphaeraceae bacterium]